VGARMVSISVASSRMTVMSFTRAALPAVLTAVKIPRHGPQHRHEEQPKPTTPVTE
jgi:hypothetical protein